MDRFFSGYPWLGISLLAESAVPRKPSPQRKGMLVVMLARLQSVTDRSSVFVSNAVNLKEHTTTLRALVTVQRQSPWPIPRQPFSKSFRLDEWLLCNRTRLGFVLGCIHTRGGGFIGIDVDYVRIFMQCCAGRRDVEIDYKQSL